MTGHTTRRRFLLAAGASAATGTLSLAGCGSGTIDSALVPKRFIGFGDGLSDIGQGGSRFTVNDGSVNNWTLQMAANYGMTLTAASAGGSNYAQGNARVASNPDAAGNAATLSVKQQIDSFLASNSFATGDVVLINGGISDIIAETMAVVAGTQSSSQALANVAAAGVALGNQVQRLVTAGAKNVLLTGVFNMSRSAWSTAIGQTTLLDAASSKFNEQLLVTVVNLGANVLYVDSAYYFNLIYASPTAYNLLDNSTVVCTSVDSTNGIGIGTGKVNSKLCNAGTIVTGLAYNSYLHADSVYFTPAAHVLFGNYAYTRLRGRW
ncbi:MAG: SGNH/GDSL hydrolase family protein [Burkholderiaceae bacterium]|jgi:outer membrane lipase/esterase|nr:SGNH/GDSL hydrolase family protein [Burkholderiaceae bacterium]